jgi:ribosome biogenesis GTPase
MMSDSTLEKFGWDSFFEGSFAPYRHQEYAVGRVAIQHKDHYVLYTCGGEVWAEVCGKMRFEASGRQDFPAVGDWVVIQPRPQEDEATIHYVLQRKTKFSRKIAGLKTEEQILAANIDTVFLVSGLDSDFNLRRIERYLSVVWESGASPIIVLNKADICDDINQKVREVESVAFGVQLLVISALHKQGTEALTAILERGRTGALLGSSGVGKSTITNLLLGSERQKVREIRKGLGRGKHTTPHRELIPLPSGGLIIDTPGMREFQLWSGGEGLKESFEDVEALAKKCRFRNCQHDHEPDCAVREAMQRRSLDPQRFQSYHKLQREIHYVKRKQDERAASLEKERWKRLTRIFNQSIKKRE